MLAIKRAQLAAGSCSSWSTTTHSADVGCSKMAERKGLKGRDCQAATTPRTPPTSAPPSPPPMGPSSGALSIKARCPCCHAASIHLHSPPHHAHHTCHPSLRPPFLPSLIRGPEYQSEVSLLSRSIQLRSPDESQPSQIGAHVMVQGEVGYKDLGRGVTIR